VAAVLIAIELLLFEWKPRSFIPVAAASAVAATLRPFLLGAGPLFPVTAHALLPWWGRLACLAAGVLAGLASGVLTALVYGFEDLFQRLPIHWMWWPALGGLAVGIGGLFEITRVADVMVRNVDTLPGSMGIDEAVRWFSTETAGDAATPTPHKSYRIVDEKSVVLGMVSRADALRWLMQGWQPRTTLATAAAERLPVVGYGDELVGALADRMAAADVGRVPILRRDDGKLIGIVTRKDLLQVRARMLVQEKMRERRPPPWPAIGFRGAG